MAAGDVVGLGIDVGTDADVLFEESTTGKNAQLVGLISGSSGSETKINPATEGTLSSIDGKDFATQATLAALLTELQLKADLLETQPVSVASLPLPSGAATEATLSSIDGKDFATQTTLAALLTELQLKADLTETQPVSAASLPLPTGAATETTLNDIKTAIQLIDDWDNGAGDGASVSGDVAHDSVDAGEPVKVGGHGIDYHPDTEGEQGRSEVANGDRVDLAPNLRGQVVEGVNGMYHLFDGTFPDTGLDGRYDDGTVGASNSTSEAVECWNYRYATVGFDLTSTSTPTNFEIVIECSPDGTNWFELKNGALSNWTYDDTFVSSTKSLSLTFQIACAEIRVYMVGTGLSGSAYFTVDNSFIYLRN